MQSSPEYKKEHHVTHIWEESLNFELCKFMPKIRLIFVMQTLVWSLFPDTISYAQL